MAVAANAKEEGIATVAAKLMENQAIALRAAAREKKNTDPPAAVSATEADRHWTQTVLEISIFLMKN